MLKIGLKLWSTNLNYIPDTREIFARKKFDYIELFIVPGSLNTISWWKNLNIPYILHAPHSFVGFNTADSSRRNANLDLVREVNVFFDVLQAELVIFHPGVNGDLQESILQFRFFGERFPEMYQKVVIENKPQVGLREERCIGASPEEMRLILSGTKRGFCLDFGHAICYSLAAGKELKDVLLKFQAMKPVMYHLCDGFFSVKDNHEHIGKGEFDLPYLISFIDHDKRITLEVKKEYPDSLDDFVEDVQRLREYDGI